MDGRSRNYEDVSHNNKLLNLIQISKEERELELRLGPPGDEQDWSPHNENNNKRERDDSSSLCFGYFSSHKIHHHQHNQHKDKAKDSSSFLGLQSSTQNMHREEKRELSPSSANDAAVPNSSQKRTTVAGPVVGWPPIRSFRKNNNIASETSSKHKPHGSHQHKLLHQSANNNNKEHVHNNIEINKGLFVKINMDGVPIGRKVDINACGNYEKLYSAVYDLFRGLLTAQRDSSGGGIQNKKKEEEEKVITGLLDHGNGEYTLAFQDHEGHNMLVGDVPWHMFVSTVKRLRVLKSSDLSALSLGSKQKVHTSLDKAMK